MSQRPERIVCEVFRVNRELSVKHQVTFGKKALDGTRKGPVSAYTYNSRKYSNASSLTTYTLDTEDYLVLEKVNFDKSQESTKILLSYQHIFKLKNALKQVKMWFYDDDYRDMFLYINDVPRVNAEFEYTPATAFGLVAGSAIMLKPAVIEIENELFEGCTMHFNTPECFISLTLDQFEALQDFIENFRLYEASRLLFNTQQLLTPIEIEARRQGQPSTFGNQSANLKPTTRQQIKHDDIQI